MILLRRFNGLLVWAAFILIFALWVPDTFLTKGTFQSIASTQAVTGLAALGLVCAMSAGALDLSFASVIGLSSAVGASLMAHSDIAPVPAVAICIAMGVGIGVINGILVTRLRISSIVATLGVSSLLLAAEERITNGQYISGIPHSFTNITHPKPFGIPIAAIYLLVAAVIIWIFLEHTRSGRRMYATGMNTDAARLTGVRTDRMTMLALVLSSTLSSIAGLVLLAQVGSGTPNVGTGYLLAGFAAVFLGATQIKPGRFNVWGTVIAIYLLATGVQGLQLAGAQGWVNNAFNGAALLIAVAFAQLSSGNAISRFARRTGRGRAKPSTQPAEAE